MCRDWFRLRRQKEQRINKMKLKNKRKGVEIKKDTKKELSLSLFFTFTTTLHTRQGPPSSLTSSYPLTFDSILFSTSLLTLYNAFNNAP